MSLPAPCKRTQRHSHSKSQQLERHLPSPTLKKLHIQKQEEKKQPANDYPSIFRNKFNTKNINWNELHYLAFIKGRLLFVQSIIKTHYSSHLNHYNLKNNKLPDIPNVSVEILKFIQQILSETSIVVTAHKSLHCHTDWQTQVDNYEGISIYYRQEADPNNAIHSIKANFTSKCHPVEFIAVLNEFDLMKEIVTICPMETTYLKQFTNLHKVIYTKINMWWPLRDRDSVAQVRAYDLLHEYDEILIWGQSFEQIEGVDIPCLPKGTLRMEVKMAEAVIKPKLMKDGTLGTEVISVFNIDFKTFLPKKILNWVTRTFAFYACKMIRDRTENLEGTTHQQRIKEKDIYKEWTQSFTEWRMRKLAQKAKN